jgi:hypothetical protein
MVPFLFFHTALQAIDQEPVLNCSSSVEPVNAVTED